MKRRDALKLAAKTPPVVATLLCGKAIADSSSHQCMADTENREVPLVTEGQDSYIRVRAIKRVTKNHGTFYKMLDIWYEESGEPTQKEVKKGKDTEVWVAVSFKPNQNMDDIEKVYVRFDEMDEGSLALTGSCWTSVSPTAGLNLS